MRSVVGKNKVPAPDLGYLGIVSDWREDGAKHIRGATLRFKKYRMPRPSWDHDHCVGCWAKFMENPGQDILTEGYATEADDWVCPTCFADLKDRMGWKTIIS